YCCVSILCVQDFYIPGATHAIFIHTRPYPVQNIRLFHDSSTQHHTGRVKNVNQGNKSPDTLPCPVIHKSAHRFLCMPRKNFSPAVKLGLPRRGLCHKSCDRCVPFIASAEQILLCISVFPMY